MVVGKQVERVFVDRPVLDAHGCGAVRQVEAD